MNLQTKASALILLLALAGSSWALTPAPVWLGNPQIGATGAPLSVQILSSSPAGSRLLLECPGFWAQAALQQGQTRTQVQLPNVSGTTTQVGLPELPAIGKLLAIPADRAVEIIIREVITQAYPCENPYLVEPPEGGNAPWTIQNQQTGIFPAAWAESSGPVILKDYRLAPVNLYPVRYDFNAKQLLLATRLDVEIRTTEPSVENVKAHFAPMSQAFGPVYEQAIDNLSEFNTATPLVGEGSRGKYLIFIADAFTSNYFLTNFITWKKQLGYQVILKPLSTVGSSAEQIKEAITAEYYAGDAPLDYVLLIGDVAGQSLSVIPAFGITKPGGGGENDPTDLQYSLLEGQDYFPDVMLGRLSVSTGTELSTALNKILAYQKNPYLTDPNWFKRALVSAGNYSDSPPAPITPAWTSLWLMDKLYDFGYTQVDTVIYWGPPQNPAFGTPLIIASINTGVGLVAYRGWGDASGWQDPIFQIPNLNDLQNGFKLPVMVSIVCQTGNFSNEQPCFGEAWIRLGDSPMTPAGGVAFFGPSDLHTNTKWNNAMYAGFFEGLLEENLYRLGQSALRSKLELYYGFPENIGSGDMVEFYFHTYNILGDPELPIWTDVPAQISLQVPDQMQPGQQVVTARATALDGSPLGGAYIAFYKQNEVLAGAVADGNGEVSVQVEPLTAGQLYVTASKQNCKAKQDSIAVQTGDFPVGISGIGTSGGSAQAGQSFDLDLTIHNYGADLITNLEAILSEADPYASIGDTAVSVGTIAGSGEATASFPVSLAAAAPDGYVVEFTLRLADASHSSEAKFTLPVGGLQLIPAGFVVESGSLQPGSTAQIRLLLGNAGIIPAQGVTGTLTCSSGAVDVLSGQVIFPAIQPNATAMSLTLSTVQVNTEAATGQQVIFELALTASNGYAQMISLPVQLGQPSTTDPLGPDSYGYYAYDDTDTEYAEAPVYAWIELDPAYAGAGATFHPMGDDVSQSIKLPFTFKYYDIEYDTLTICSNGYISFGTTWMAEFRNWNLPSALGPPALVAPFWDDLKPDTSGGNPDADINVFARYDEAEGRYIVEWSRTINRYGYENLVTWKRETFEVVLYDATVHPTISGDGEILFQYLEVHDVDDNNNYATVGIEDEGHRRGLQYVYSYDYPSAAALLAANRAIKITTDPPGAYGSFKQGEARFGPTFDSPQPNPANPGTMLRFTLPQAGHAVMELYNTLGQRVALLVSADLEAGQHRLELNGANLSSGIYIAVLRFQDAALSQKILILK